MDNIVLHVYEKDMKTVKKECTAQMVDVPFGVIRKFMSLFDGETLDNAAKLLPTIFSAWEDVTDLLGRIFPDITDEDWDTVSTKELVRVVYQLLKYGFAEMLKIPTSGN